MSSTENLSLELKLISAEDIRYVNVISRMDPYAVVSIIGDHSQKEQKVKTPVDHSGGTNPKWNHTVNFSVNHYLAHQGFLTLAVKLVSYRQKTRNGDRDIGEVNVPLRELMYPNPPLPLTNGDGNNMKMVTYPVKVTAGTKGTLKFSYRFDLPPCGLGNPLAPPLRPSYSASPQIYMTAVGHMILELFIDSVEDIVLETDANAVVWIDDGHETMRIHKFEIPIAQSYGTNHAVKFPITESSRDGGLTLVMKLIHERSVVCAEMGEVRVPVQELLDLNPPLPSTCGDGNGMRSVTYPVKVPTGTKGTLSFTYRFHADPEKKKNTNTNTNTNTNRNDAAIVAGFGGLQTLADIVSGIGF